jgi:type I restriction enzyme R subunit
VRYFCGTDQSDPDALKAHEPKRVKLYQLVGSLLRAYANLANEMREAGYTAAEIQTIKQEVAFYEQVRQEVKLASGDYIDLKLYEPAMRHLLDTYIRAEESEKLSAFDDMTLVELIVQRGTDALVEALPRGIRQDEETMAETIENNVRRRILDEMAVNPKYYEKMSDLLDALIQTRKQEAMDYQEYLAKIADLARNVVEPATGTTYPASIHSAARRALYDNLDQNEALVIELDEAIRTNKKDGWRDSLFKWREVQKVVGEVLSRHGGANLDEVMEIVKNQHAY